ncbi:GGDEF domain-containing protein [Hydrogenimonas urashimensis]|uniref:GGDEF domain-containing protein n=1 Tax=Hydrogenimonas urashimensis TaxID=2740515 RepID=UPI0019158CC9|nr:GGDEF domain-containing protein [Hydrogenimonas urashimensis]
MSKIDKRLLRRGGVALGLAMAASLLLSAIAWLLAKNGLWTQPMLGIEIMAAVYVVFFAPLFYTFVQQKSVVDRIEREQEESLLRDVTTRLYKSKVFRELAGTQIRLCKRNGWPVGMILMDIDQLAGINKAYSFDAGNQVLSHFAAILKETIRESDLVARFDDDRFVVLLPNCDINSAKRVVQRFQNQILSTPLTVDKKEIKIRFSCGVVSFAGRVAKFNHLINRANVALEQAKKKGGNRIELF